MPGSSLVLTFTSTPLLALNLKGSRAPQRGVLAFEG